jgi:hypothetical protein
MSGVERQSRRERTTPEYEALEVVERAERRDGQPTRSEDLDHDRLRDSPPDRTYYEGLIRLPGYREAPNRCRDYDPVGVCNDAHIILGRSSCDTRYCPDHWTHWQQGAIGGVAKRAAAYREAAEGWDKRMCHVIVSPPQDRQYSVREFFESRRDAYDVLEECGVRGGAMVAHPYRQTDEADRLYEASSESSSDDGMSKWRFLRSLSRDLPGDDWEEMERFVQASPHYHCLALGRDIDGSEAPDGWIVENRGSFDRFEFDDSESYLDMIRTPAYLLTHTLDMEGRSSTTYFGDLHSSRFSPEEALTAARWDRIQREVDKHLDNYWERIFEDEEEEAECPREGCSAAILDASFVTDLLDNEDWKARIRTLQGGRKRLLRLRGLVVWWEGRADRPPPSTKTSKERMRDWLEALGRTHTAAPRQQRLGRIMS